MPNTNPTPTHITDDTMEPMQTGPFEPAWDSMLQYESPGWFRDAKFGIWAHWGPQCQPEHGDWYARHMYFEGHENYQFHCEKYGHPSEFGFKDVIHEWKAENWNPDALVALYKRAGAQYFFAMANHHDNLDLWDSKHQAWNSVNLGPQQDLLRGWADAAKKYGLPLGLSVHAAHAWSWLEGAQGADEAGPLAGVPYDGNLRKEDGAGTWWEGYDPQELYAQNHPRSEGSEDVSTIHRQWGWENGASIPDAAFCENIYNRTIDLINQFEPELLYFDDTVLPLYPISDAGLKIAAHFYNTNWQRHGELKAVLFGKILDETQRKMMVWDIERGTSDRIEPLPWQACTCIGEWHYDRRVYDQKRYKSVAKVVHTLVDVVSKNGCLLLNVPVRGDGSIDEQELAVVEGIAAWTAVHGEAIFGTRPWKVFGEGPASEDAPPLVGQGFNEGKGKPFSAQDVRFTTKGDDLYIIVLGVPAEKVTIKSLGMEVGLWEGKIGKIELLGSKETIGWNREGNALTIEAVQNWPTDVAPIFKVSA